MDTVLDVRIANAGHNAAETFAVNVSNIIQVRHTAATARRIASKPVIGLTSWVFLHVRPMLFNSQKQTPCTNFV